ncbi:MAG: hypothetical protein AABY00_00745 [Nanoarchaeota archaeon]
MNISKEDISRIALGFGGTLSNSSSLDFALDQQQRKKLGIYKKLAYLMRAILIDHPFSDGNQKHDAHSILKDGVWGSARALDARGATVDPRHKKTAMFITFAFADQHKKTVDRELLKHHMLSIASKNISDIRVIAERLKHVIH